METLAASELRKLIALSRDRIGLWSWRTPGGTEVDFLLERRESVVGIEVKRGAGFSTRAERGPRDCADALGRRFRLGIIAHGGDRSYVLSDRLAPVPLTQLFGG